jgi:4-amino-4-deoxy-L-arabinose transferase-like glycosyltransferase
MVIVLALLILAPFLGKALTIDDPLFIWQAKHLQYKPFDPFGFETNWFGIPRSMLINVQNPPLTCYWLALVGFVSWNETWLHLSLLPFALLSILGVIQIARRLGANPFWAALLTLGSAGFLVSATNLMCDVMLTCGMIWSIYLWIKGLDRNNTWILIAAALLAGLAALTKYFGISLIPLLAAYTLIRQKEPTWSLAPLLAAIAIIFGWHFWTLNLYGVSHVLGAQRYAEVISKRFDEGSRYYAAMTFLGGCILWPIVIVLLRTRLLGRIILAAIAIFGGLILGHLTDRLSPVSYIFGAVFFAAGISVLWLTGDYHLKKWRSPETWLVALWIWGTIIFMGVLNWTVAARSLLPMIPALAILATMPKGETGDRRNALSASGTIPLPFASFAIAAILGLALAVLATWADFDWANNIRRAAYELTAKYKSLGNRVFFQGHWGFQYYMEQAGAASMDLRYILPAADVVGVFPFNNSNVYPRALDGWDLVESREEKSGFGFYLTAPSNSAGFYSHLLGVLPLSFTTGNSDIYVVMKPPDKARAK